jgi:hypothetical protein
MVILALASYFLLCETKVLGKLIMNKYKEWRGVNTKPNA